MGWGIFCPSLSGIAAMNLTDPIFTDADKAREHLEATRWPHGPECPHCGVVDQATSLNGKAHRPGVWQCNACREQFSATVGTVFESSHVPLNKWMLASYLMAASKKGVSALQIQRTIGVSYKTAWFMMHRLREGMVVPANPAPLGGEGKIVEADTAYVGGKEKNKHVSKRDPKAIGGMGKQAVHVLVERGGRARHETVNHTQDEYVRGDAYSNTAEGFFAILKRGVYGTFHSISEAHLHRYLAEFDFRYSNRIALGIDDTMRTAELLRGIGGKRLTYRRTSESAHA